MCRTLRMHDSTTAVPIVICGPLRRSDRELIAAHPGPIRRAQLLPSDLRTTVAAALDASFQPETVAGTGSLPPDTKFPEEQRSLDGLSYV
jgi:hypothetical protein